MMKSFSNLLKLTLITLTGLNAIHASGQESCRLKYIGNLVTEDELNSQIGIAGRGNLLGQVGYTISDGSVFTACNFEFYECMINGYYRYPDEYGFLIAKPVNSAYCSTAFDVDGYSPKKSALNHHQCDYSASNKTLINRQLVYANYIRPTGSPGQVQITFQGSPNDATRSGFDSRHAYFRQDGVKYAENNAVIISNDAITPKLLLIDVQIAPHESMVEGKRTTNEQRIVNAVNAGQDVLFSKSAQDFLLTNNHIF